MTDWGSLAVGYVGGLVTAAVAAFLIPARTWAERLGRRVLEPRPLDTHVETDLEVIWAGCPDWVGAAYFFEGGPPPHEPTPTLGLFQALARRHGGIPCGQSCLQLTLVSKSAATVVVGTPVVHAIPKDLPPGVRVVRPVGGASLESTAIDIELTGMGPRIRVHHPGGQDTRALSWVLKQGEAQRFLVRITVEGDNLWRWHGRLPLIVDGRSLNVPLGNAQHPFEICGYGDGRQADLATGADSWVPSPI